MGSFALANTLAVLAAGRDPQWVQQLSGSDPDVSGAPSSTTSGVYLEDAVVAAVKIRLREDIAKRTARLTATHDAGTTYNVIIDGNTKTVATPASMDALITGMRDQLNASPTAAIVTATALDSDGVDVTTSGNSAVELLIQGDTETDYSINATVSGAAGTWATVKADALTADARLYAKPGGAAKSTSNPKSDAWVQINGGAFLTASSAGLDYRGFLERFNTAGMDRLYVELESVTGHASDGGSVTQMARVWIGPCVDESS